MKLPKLPMKKILIIVGGLVLIGATAGGGLFMGLKMNKSEAEISEEPTVADEIVADATGEASGGHSTGNDAPASHGEESDPEEPAVSMKDLIYNFERHFTINLQDPTGQVYIQVAIQIKTTSPENCVELDDYVAPLRDATIMLLSGKKPADINNPAGKERLKNELRARYEGILREDMIEEIYLTDWMILKQ